MRDKSFKFAVEMVKYCSNISDYRYVVLSKQLIRSATSIGANVEEALGAQSKKDFVAKLYIVSKETRETIYWLRLLNEIGVKNNSSFDKYIMQANEILRITNSTILTTKKNMENLSIKSPEIEYNTSLDNVSALPEDISAFSFQLSALKRRAVFFDRDGVLNIDHGYVFRPEDWQWTPGAIDAIKWCNDNGYLVIVVTNQSGVARGYYSEADVVQLHEWVNEDLRRHQAKIEAFYYCPHYPNASVLEYALECNCRKPQPGMLLAAIAKFNIAVTFAVMFGDKPGDIEAASAAGIRGVLVEKNAGWSSLADFVVAVNQ